MNAELKEFAKVSFPDSKSDLFAIFIERGFELLKEHGLHAMVTMQSWMFLCLRKPPLQASGAFFYRMHGTHGQYGDGHCIWYCGHGMQKAATC